MALRMILYYHWHTEYTVFIMNIFTTVCSRHFGFNTKMYEEENILHAFEKIVIHILHTHVSVCELAWF